MELIIRESDIAKLPVKSQELAKDMMNVLAQMIAGIAPDSIRSPRDIYQLSLDLVPAKQEHFAVYFLNSKNHVIERKTIFIGTLNASVAHPREVFRAAIEHASASIICVHNHPSGDPTPSPEDIDMTKRLYEAGEIVGIDVLDHVIVSKNGYISLKEKRFF